MTRNLRIVLSGTAVAGSLLAMSWTPAFAGPAVGVSAAARVAKAALAAAPISYEITGGKSDCSIGYFCIWNGPDYTDDGWAFSGGVNVPYLSDYSGSGTGGTMRNADESFYNNTSDPARPYYSPDYGGAHTCIKGGQAFPNLLSPTDYYFNTGPNPGVNDMVYRDVASLTIDTTGSCSAPMSGE
jgi:Peptidase inhibitor family I36